MGLLLVLLLSFASCAWSYGYEPVINFQVDAGGSTTSSDNSNAFVKAVSLATSTGLPIYVPPGYYNFQQTINSTNVIIRGAGPSKSVFVWTKQLGSGYAAFEIYGGDSQIWQLGFLTSFGRPQLGQYYANFYGIRLNANIQLHNVESQAFYAGVVWNSPYGHTSAQYLHSSNNYYGIYVQQSNGDNFVEISGLEGNTMASIGLPPTGALSGGDSFYRVHMCFGPYGVYQEGPANTGYQTFIADTHFQLARFESCGNGAIFTENAGTGAYGGLSGNEFYNVGFSWNPTYRITSRKYDYAVNVGTTQQTSYYFPGVSGFNKGNIGIWNLNQGNGWGGIQAFNSSPVAVPGS